jgi:dTDP-glucose pyrophosphorylase
MQFAVLAAGNGSRLKESGIKLPKPLVKVGGVTLIHRLFTVFQQCGATKISVIINPDSGRLLNRILRMSAIFPLYFRVQTTESSMHSLYELLPILDDDKLCLTTVDTVFEEKKFKKYIDAFSEMDDCDALMAVTQYIDDEKPLYVNVDDDMNIKGFYDEDNKEENYKYISAGIYGLTPACMEVLKECISEGKQRMRTFQQELINHGLKVKAFDIGDVIDVDSADDILKARKLIKKKNCYVPDARALIAMSYCDLPVIMALGREKFYSPGRQMDDLKIYNNVIKELEKRSYIVKKRVESYFHEHHVKDINAVAVFSMARSSKALSQLSKVEVPVINSAQGVRNCLRIQQMELLEGAYYLPAYHCCKTSDMVHKVWNSYPCWVKNADTHTTSQYDVVFAKSLYELQRAKREMYKSKVKHCVIQEHIEGTLYKFYGVRGKGLITISKEQGYDKFGYRYKTNDYGSYRNYTVDSFPAAKDIEMIALDAANRLNVDVYGGDVIVTEDNRVFLIDFNDWPSYRTCRKKAAVMIADLIEERIAKGDGK